MQGSHQTGSKVPRALDRLIRLQTVHAWTVVLLCVDLAALGDLLTGPDLWLGPVYLFVMCLAAWSLGWRAGQAVGVGCMALTFAINGASLYPYGTAEMVWNLGMRFAAISLVVTVVAGARRAYLSEWWLARTDVLTGALNRQAFFELADGVVDARRWRLLIYADLDGLKQINDRYGHAAGDRSLKAYAAAVRQGIRRNDLFARVGGDEFLVFMAVKDETAARAVASRLHLAMNATPTNSGGYLRCSVGALVISPGERSLDALVCRADNLMYDAKLRGGALELGHVLDPAPDGSPERLGGLLPAPGAVFLPARSNAPDRRERTE
jgi:diguanylate cyclase (GGDEF)-like protein